MFSLVVLVFLRRQVAGREQFLGGVPQQTLQVTHEPVDVPLPGRLVDDVLIVVVPESAREFLIVHLGLVFTDAPAAGYLVRVG